MRYWSGLILLVLGMITTVVVAWRCAYLVDPNYLAMESFERAVAGPAADGSHGGWSVWHRKQVMYEEITSWWCDAGINHPVVGRPQGDPEHLLPWWLWGIEPRPFPTHQPGTHSHTVHVWGWPVPAMYYQSTGHGAGQRVPHMDEFRFAKRTGTIMRQLPQNAGTVNAVLHRPLMPALPGFAIDTVLYACAWAMVLMPVYLVYAYQRRRRRIARGHCPKCDYYMGGAAHAQCPERGRAAAA